ncbi:expressed protein [Chlorella variabilis]|uniref:Expressed protein n=1 Tax=Chlorella variabilis TaxID=554065 RepID=E1ZQM5_CHLVA|nr:expressed protein [Chlorella variabilis]EFN51822.1 expressed protein [Chlorella variabilis]|eukprot:XP_005843924.1 expressed protein [Chlorella variabilis]
MLAYTATVPAYASCWRSWAASSVLDTNMKIEQAIGLQYAQYAGPVLAGLLCFTAQGWVTDRIEDATLHLRPKEEQQRLHAVRAWRHQLDKEEHREWVATGLLGPSLRQLAPEYYSAQLEQQIAAAAPAGPTVHKYEVAWLLHQLADGPDFVSVPARLSFTRHGDVLGVPAQLAQELGLAAGAIISYSIAGREFASTVAILALPGQAQLEAQVQAEAVGMMLSAKQQELAVAQLSKDYIRCVWVPLPTLQLLIAQGVAVSLH